MKTGFSSSDRSSPSFSSSSPSPSDFPSGSVRFAEHPEKHTQTHRVSESEREKWLVISPWMDVTMYFSLQEKSIPHSQRRREEERGEHNWPNGKGERGEEAGREEGRKGGRERQGLGDRKECGGDESKRSDECEGQKGEAEKRQPNETLSKGEEGSWTT